MKTGGSAATGRTLRSGPGMRAAEPGPEIDPRIGSVVAARYRVLERLGHGGMAVVYRARDLTLDVDVAMKVLPIDAGDPAFEDVQREVRLARKVTHRNVCRLHDVVIGDGIGCCITMELIDGESLADRLARDPPLGAADGLAILREVAAGMAAAHAAQVVHRDLKPANVLIDDAGRVVVADFGIATRAHAADASLGAAHGDNAEIAGTTGYMSPEQLAGAPLDARSDVYAFGALAVRVLSGLLAAPGDDVRAALADQPAGVAELVARCLAANAADRPADGAALVAALAEREAPGALSAPADRGALGPRGPGGPRASSDARWPAGVEDLGKRRTVKGARVRHRFAGRIAALLACAAAAAAALLLVRPGARPGRAPRFSLGAFTGTAAEPWLGDSLAARLRDELIDAWGVEVTRTGPGDVALAGQLAVAGAGLRASTGMLAIEATGLDELVRSLARRIVERDVPEPVRRPTAADLAAAGTSDADAWRQWRRGQRQAMLQHWPRAIELYGDALRRDPGFALAQLELGESYDVGDELQLPALHHAFELATRRPPMPPWQLELDALAAMLRGDPRAADAAIGALRRAVTDDRDRLFIDVRSAIGRLVTGQDSRALAELEVIRETWPDDAAALIALCDHYAGSDEPGAIELALRTSELALRLAPDEVAVRADRALALVRTGQLDAARREIEGASHGDASSRASARSSLFAYHMAVGDVAEATAEARRMLAGTPRQRIAGALGLALVDLYDGRFDTGLDGYRSAAASWDQIGMTTSSSRTRFEAARLAFQLGRSGVARELLVAAARPDTHYRAPANVLLALLDRGPAAARAALAALPPGASARLWLDAAVANAAGEGPAAIAAHRRARDQATEVATAFYAARAMAGAGQTAEAIELYRRLVTHPDAWREPILSADAWRELGDLHRSQGDSAAAHTAYQVYLARRSAALATPEIRAIRAWLDR
jgi:tetratricopeptide (TPR) repeat protein